MRNVELYDMDGAAWLAAPVGEEFGSDGSAPAAQPSETIPTDWKAAHMAGLERFMAERATV